VYFSVGHGVYTQITRFQKLHFYSTISKVHSLPPHWPVWMRPWSLHLFTKNLSSMLAELKYSVSGAL